jgi:hypothetical protein
VPTNEQQWFDFEPSAPVATAEAPLPLPMAVPQSTPDAGEEFVLAGGDEVLVRRSPKALRYRLSVGRDGAAVLTIPIRGSERQARQFLESQRDWLERTRSRWRGCRAARRCGRWARACCGAANGVSSSGRRSRCRTWRWARSDFA